MAESAIAFATPKTNPFGDLLGHVSRLVSNDGEGPIVTGSIRSVDPGKFLLIVAACVAAVILAPFVLKFGLMALGLI